MVHPAGVEPAAYGIGIRHSIHLSYGCIWWGQANPVFIGSAFLFASFQHSNFLPLISLRFLYLNFRNDFSSLH